MEFELSTAPTSEPVTVDDIVAQSQIGEIPNDQYGHVQTLIVAARRLVEARLRRQLITATWKAYLEAWPEEIEIREKLPVSSITSIQYVDTDGDTQTLASTEYQTDYASKDRPCRIKPAYGKTWPSLRGDTYKSVTITFVAGYGSASDVPAGIRQAIIATVATWYENREALAPIPMHSLPMVVDHLLASEDWGFYG